MSEQARAAIGSEAIEAIPLYDPQKPFGVRKLGLRHFLTRVWAVSCVHGQWFKAEPKGTIELNQ
jgi:hypothetical protein